MDGEFTKQVRNILVCPYCSSSLRPVENGVKCSGCQEEYPFPNKRQLDLRLKKKKLCQLEFELGTDLFSEEDFTFGILGRNTTPEVDFTKIKAPWHLNKKRMSYFPKATSEDSLMLDLGCGNIAHKDICTHAGFKYVGLDYNTPEAPILGDAHALPFANNSFEFVLSVAVLEHIQYPFVAMKEVYRVLKPGCRFVGSVSFLEPFHQDSFYHHTHLGVFNSLKFAGFDVEQISSDPSWQALKAQAIMGLFPRLPHFIAKFLVLPLHMLHRLWWNLGCFCKKAADERTRIRRNAGCFFFVARKAETK